MLAPEVAPDPDFRSRHRQDSVFFFQTWSQSQKFVKNWTRSDFSISAVAAVCVVISSVKAWEITIGSMIVAGV